MPVGSYRFNLEMDASQAKGVADEFHQYITGKLSGLDIKLLDASALRPAMQQVEQVKQALDTIPAVRLTIDERGVNALKTLRDELGKLGKVDLTGMGIEAMEAKLRQAEQQARKLEQSLMEVGLKANAAGAGMPAHVKEFYQQYRQRNEGNISFDVGEFTKAQEEGRVPSQKWMQNQDLDSSVLPQPYKWGQKWTDKVEEYQKLTTEVMQEAVTTEARLYEAQAQKAQIEKALAEQRIAEIERSIGALSDDASEDDVNRLFGEMATYQEVQASALGEEAAAFDRLTQMRERVSADVQAGLDAAIKEARQAEARKGNAAGLVASPSTGEVVQGQIRVTVADKSVENAQNMVAPAKELLKTMQELVPVLDTVAQKQQTTDKGKADEEIRIIKERSAARQEEIRLETEALRIQTGADSDKNSTQKRLAELKKESLALQKLVKDSEAARLAEKTRLTEAQGSARIAETITKGVETRKSQTHAEESRRRMEMDKAEAKARMTQDALAAKVALEEEKRITAGVRAELNQRANANAMLKNAGRSLLYGAAGALGIYSVESVGRQLWEGGQQGASMMRMEASFETLAEGAGLAADVLREELSDAVQHVITDEQLMAETNLLLVASQRGQIQISEEQIGTLARYARLRSTQVTIDGRALTAQEAYSRMIRGIVKRETELLDELGLSTKTLAAEAGVSIQVINKDVQSLLDAILSVGEKDIANFGDPALDALGQMEQASNRTQEALNELRKSLADPVIVVMEFGGDVAEWVTANRLGNSASQDLLSEDVLPSLVDPIRAEIRKIKDEFTGEKITIMGADTGLGATRDLFDLDLVKGQASAYDTLRQAVTDLTDAHEILNDTEKTAGADPAIIEEAGQEWDRIVDQMGSGTLQGEELTQRTNDYVTALRLALGLLQDNTSQASILGDELQNAAKNAYQLAQEQRYKNAPSDPSLHYLQSIGASLPYATGNTPQERRTERLLALTEQRGKLEEAIAKDRAALDKSTADQAGQAWSAAAKQTAQAAIAEFDRAFQAIEGLTSPSQVTQEQLDAAKAGMPQNFADDYLRRLKDEVINGVDWADVSVQDAANRMGLDPGLDPKVILQQMEQKWANQELFAGGANLDLVNWDAVRAGYKTQEDAKSGMDALRRRTAEELGIPLSDLEAQVSSQELATNSNTDSLDENTRLLSDVNQELSILNSQPPAAPGPLNGGTATTQTDDLAGLTPGERKAVLADRTPTGYQYTQAQYQALEDGKARAKAARLAQGVKGYSQEMSGGVPESTMTPGSPSSKASATLKQFMGGSMPIEGGGMSVKTKTEWENVWKIQDDLLAAELAATGGPGSGKMDIIGALMDLFMGSSMPIEGGVVDRVVGDTVYTPWPPQPEATVPLPPVDAQGYGRPLIPGLDTPPGLTSGHMGGDTLTTPAPYTDIQPMPTTGLGTALLPGWLTGADSTMPADFKLYLPLVTNEAALDEALGDQPEKISTRLIDRIGAGIESGASLLNPLVNAWGIDLSDDGLKQLDPLADRVSDRFNSRLFGNLGKPDGDFVGAIVAKVLEALTAE